MLATCSNDMSCKILNPDTFEVYKKFDKKAAVRCAFFYPIPDPVSLKKFHVFIGGGQDAKDVALTGNKSSSFETKIFNLITGQDLG